MLTAIVPKLPMRNKAATKAYYINQLGFTDIGTTDYNGYLLLQKEGVEIHFFEFTELDPAENYGQVYVRTTNLEELYNELLNKQVGIHPAGHLHTKPWGQKEFSLLDPDNNLLTFGEAV